MYNKKILISAGGTGGHILPALSIAESLQSADDALQIEFVSGSSLLEKNIYSQIGFKVHFLSVGRLRKNVNWKERYKTFFSLPFVLLKALWLVMKTKPSLVLGTGGAVSGPILFVAFLLCRQTVIFESNAVPGLTTRWLSRFVNEVIFVFPATTKYLKARKQTKFPFPVRSQICSISLKEKPDQPLRILVLGGSQGSSLINKVVSEFIVSSKSRSLAGSDTSGQVFSFIHQTGKKEFEHLKKMYSAFDGVEVFPFLWEIHKFYKWSDIVIGRAGAGSIAELSVIGRLGILVPLASSADQHQLRNAQALEKKSAITLMEEKTFNKHALSEILKAFVNHPQRIKQMSYGIHKLKLGAKADNISLYLQENYISPKQ